MAISSSGIGSGLDVEKIITQLVALEKRPLDQLQAKAESIKTKVSTFGEIKSQLSALADAASKLRLDSAWTGLNITSSNPTAVSAVVTGQAVPTALSVEVQKLARAQSTASAAVPSGANIGSGTLSIELGSWASDMSTFTAGAAGAVSVEVTATDTVTSIAAKINSANAGVTATVLKDASGERLLVRSKETGLASGFRIQAADDDGDNADAAGLSQLAFDPENATQGLALKQQAQNAEARINGVEVTATKNELVDVIPGFTIQLMQETTTPAEISMSTDTAIIRKNIQDFITAYNALNQTLLAATRYDPDTKTAGILQGDSTAVSLRNALRSLVGSSTGGVPFQRLADIGIDIGLNGDLALGGTKFDNALKNLTGLKQLFAANTGNPGTDGFGLKIKNFAQGLLSIDGTISRKTDALDAQIDSNAKLQDKVNLRAEAAEKRLRAQYTALDVKMGSLSALNSYITQQITLWNNNKN